MAIDMRTLEGPPEEWGCSLYVMRLLAAIMDAAALLDAAPAPATPPWTIAVDPERERTMWWALADRAYEAELTAPERAEVERIRPAIERHRRTRSVVPDRVPGFKFEGMSTWIVTPEESALVAARLDALEDTLLAHVLEGENANRAARALADVSIDDVRPTLDEWIAYNRLAAMRGGYEIS